MNPDRLAVVFGGGGVKAAAHAGAWRAILEAGLTPRHVFGTSMGAVIGACFAASLTVEQLAVRMGSITQASVAQPRKLAAVRGLSIPSLFFQEPLRATIAAMVPVTSFAELRIPLTVTAVDIDTGVLHLFGNGGVNVPLIDALVASCSLPVFYPPVVIDGHRMVDGGLRAVLPLAPAAESGADLVIAVNTGPGFDEAGEPAAGMPPLLAAHNDATGILMATSTQQELELWKATPGRPPLIYVRPRVDKHVTFRVDLAGKYLDEGYRATREELAKLESKSV